MIISLVLLINNFIFINPFVLFLSFFKFSSFSFPFFLTIFIFLSLVFSQSFYITFHGGKSGFNNVAVYSLNGTNLGNLLQNEDGHASLRGLAYNTTDATIYIASAKDNTLITTNGCSNGVNVFSDSSDLVHPYGVALDCTLNRAYVSNQDGNNVVYFKAVGSSAVEFASGVTNPRGIAVDKTTSNVYVASEDLKAVLGYDQNGNQIRKFSVDIPIGVYIDDGVLYISNRGVDPGTFAYNLTSGVKIMTYASEDPHPTGIVLDKGILYVLGQTNQMLYHYNAVTGQSLGSLVSFKDDYPEQIILGPCQKLMS